MTSQRTSRVRTVRRNPKTDDADAIVREVIEDICDPLQPLTIDDLVIGGTA